MSRQPKEKSKRKLSPYSLWVIGALGVAVVLMGFFALLANDPVLSQTQQSCQHTFVDDLKSGQDKFTLDEYKAACHAEAQDLMFAYPQILEECAAEKIFMANCLQANGIGFHGRYIEALGH